MYTADAAILVLLNVLYHTLATNDEQMEADSQALNELYQVEEKFAEMLLAIKQEYNTCSTHYTKMKDYLDRLFPGQFSCSSTFEELLRTLQLNRLIGPFNIDTLCAFTREFPMPKVQEVVELFTSKKNKFLSTTTVGAFLQAVCCRDHADPCPKGMDLLEIKLFETETRKTSLEEVEKIAERLSNNGNKCLLCYSTTPSYISWWFSKPKDFQLIPSHIQGVQEVKIGGRSCFFGTKV